MAKRIGIMSMQRIVNYGSSLQAYGLKRLVEQRDPESEVSFLDYRPGPVTGRNAESTGLRGRCGRVLSKFRELSVRGAPVVDRLRHYDHIRKHTFEHKRNYAERNFEALGIARIPQYDVEVDVQIIGSDEVFNCLQSNPRVGYSRDLFGHESKAKLLASYAASFGNATLERIQQAGVANELTSDLSRFRSISVRDQNSAKIIETLTGRIPSVNVDPVLAYDFMAMEPSVPSHRMHDRRYMILYAYPGRISRAENELVQRFAKRRGLDILSFGGAHLCATHFIDCTPFELLAYFRDAEAVVTDTFHGTIFSMINNRPFATIMRSSVGYGYGNEEKIGHLLRTFNLVSRSLFNLDQIESILDEPMDRPRLHEMLEGERRNSDRYLRNLLAIRVGQD